MYVYVCVLCYHPEDLEACLCDTGDASLLVSVRWPGCPLVSRLCASVGLFLLCLASFFFIFYSLYFAISDHEVGEKGAGTKEKVHHVFLILFLKTWVNLIGILLVSRRLIDGLEREWRWRRFKGDGYSFGGWFDRLSGYWSGRLQKGGWRSMWYLFLTSLSLSCGFYGPGCIAACATCSSISFGFWAVFHSRVLSSPVTDCRLHFVLWRSREDNIKQE